MKLTKFSQVNAVFEALENYYTSSVPTETGAKASVKGAIDHLKSSDYSNNETVLFVIEQLAS